MKLEMDVTWTPPPAAPAEPAPFSLHISTAITSDVTGVFGISGAGKSTLLAILAGLVRPRAGRATLDGEVLFDLARGVFVPPHRRRVAVVFQDGRLFPHLDVLGNLRYPRPARARTSDREKHLTFDEVVELLALGPLLDRRVTTLSGGEQQRVALGRALLARPRLLLLDEPLASLDAGMKRQVLPLLQRVARCGVPMLYVSHDVGEILHLTSDLLVLDGGRVVGQGAFHGVVRDPAVFRIAARTGLENVLRARVLQHLPDAGLTRVEIVSDVKASGTAMASEWVVPPLERAVGETVSLAIRPEDIAIALTRHDGVSIQNQIRGVVLRETDVAGRGLVEVDVGYPLLVEVSLRAVANLNLHTGREVFCLFKAHAVRCLEL